MRHQLKKRQLWIERINQVEREFRATRSALDLLAERLRGNPTHVNSEEWSARDAERSSENLEATYFVRLFAEFESGLRDLWRNYHKKKRRTPMHQLLQLVATQSVPWDCVIEADEVRIFRNALVHEETDEPMTPLSLSEAKGRLCRYFSFLPLDW